MEKVTPKKQYLACNPRPARYQGSETVFSLNSRRKGLVMTCIGRNELEEVVAVSDRGASQREIAGREKVGREAGPKP